MIKFHLKNLNIWTSEKKDESIIFYPGLNKPSHIPHKILKSISIPRQKIIETNQVHSDKVVVLDNLPLNDDKFVKIPLCDGLITQNPDIALMIKTADCIPLVIYDSKQNLVASIHAGWRGLVKNIHTKTIKIFEKKYKSNLNNIQVFIGPSIRKCCYSFPEKPTQANQKLWKKFINLKNNLWYIDLQGYLTESLINLGIKKSNIVDSNLCTYHLDKQFFSHLRHIHKSDTSGSMVTIVQLKP